MHRSSNYRIFAMLPGILALDGAGLVERLVCPWLAPAAEE
jgi:hypothetical protein